MNIDKSTQTKLQQQARFLLFCAYLLWLLSLLLFLLLFPLTSKAWTTEQKQLAGIATTLMVVDWAQTRHEGENPIILLNPFHIISVELIGDQTRVALTNNTAVFVQETLEEIYNAIGA